MRSQTAGPKYRAHQTLETTALQDGAVLFHPKLGKFVMLNRSAAVLWAELSTPRTEDELIQSLGSTFADVPAETVRQDVRDALQLLEELDLVSESA